MEISISNFHDHTVITVDGDIEYHNVGVLKKTINAMIEEDTRSILLDMKEVCHIDSMAIGLLAVTQKKMKTREGKFGLFNVRPDIMALLKISSIDRMLTIHDSLDEVG